MKFNSYVRDHFFSCLIYIFITGFILLFLFLFHVNNSLIVMIGVLLVLLGLFLLCYNYLRKRTFFRQLARITEELDQKYLLSELLSKPTFYEGTIFYETLYQANKSMLEKIQTYAQQQKELQDYMELWLHEIKIPLASGILALHNQSADQQEQLTATFERIETYLEQVLYYVRSETTEQDYYIQTCELKGLVSKVLLRKKRQFLHSKMELELQDLGFQVRTDAKWMEFMIQQLIENSMKYQAKKIIISGKKDAFGIHLEIKDDGIGIPASDLPRVLEKTFTGANGRKVASATGMGLYICTQLCDKLGHKITVTSQEGEFTKVTITFSKEEYYGVLS